MIDIEFEVGQKYENMKGMYEVISIDKDDMLIRWDNGEEVTTTMVFQSRIIQRIQREREPPEPKKTKKKKKAPKKE